MTCRWGHNDCRYAEEKCALCLQEDFYYKRKRLAKRSLSRAQAKQSQRAGSAFEYRNHIAIRDTLSGATTRMTPNSGAGRIKGDQEISGLITVMEELKTRTKRQAGKQSFTIKKDWLTKLEQEAREENKEFWYLKFSFLDTGSEDVYVIVGADMIMSMVMTMVSDRKRSRTERLKAAVAEKHRQKLEADLIAAQAEIQYLQAKLQLMEEKP